MVAHLVRLKLALLRNTLRRSTGQLVGLIVGLLYGAFLVTVLLTGVVALRFEGSVELTATVLVLGGSALLLAWALIPVLVFGVDPTVDPARFATFGVNRRELAVGLIVAGLVSVPAVVTALALLATVIAWSRGPGALSLAILLAPVALLTAVLASRVTTAWAGAVLRSRRGRDVRVWVIAALLLGYGPLLLMLTGGGVSFDRTDEIAESVGWTPLGWVFAAPASMASGRPLAAVAQAALAVGLLLALAALWTRLCAAVVENPHGTSAGRTSRHTGLGLFARMPGTPTGAVAARSATAWRRDPRYQISAIVLPLVPLGFVVLYATGAGPWILLLMAPMGALMIGFGAHNDLAYDSTAYWMHVSSGVSGRADRIGRLVPYAVVAAVSLPIYSVVGPVAAARPDLIPAWLGLSVLIVCCGWGVSSVTSALLPYPVPGPGENPFSTPPGSTWLSFVGQTVSTVATVVLGSPVIALAVWAYVGGPGWVTWVALGLGLVSSPLVVQLGVRIGARYLDASSDRVLAKLTQVR